MAKVPLLEVGGHGSRGHRSRTPRALLAPRGEPWPPRGCRREPRSGALCACPKSPIHCVSHSGFLISEEMHERQVININTSNIMIKGSGSGGASETTLYARYSPAPVDPANWGDWMQDDGAPASLFTFKHTPTTGEQENGRFGFVGDVIANAKKGSFEITVQSYDCPRDTTTGCCPKTPPCDSKAAGFNRCVAATCTSSNNKKNIRATLALDLLKPGDQIKLKMDSGDTLEEDSKTKNPAAQNARNKFLKLPAGGVASLDSTWTDIKKKGVALNERHTIKAINRIYPKVKNCDPLAQKKNAKEECQATRVTLVLHEPLMHDVWQAYNFKVEKEDLARGWGVEDVHLVGGWSGPYQFNHFNADFQHHSSWVGDEGWKGFSFDYGYQPFVRRVRVSNVSGVPVEFKNAFGASCILTSVEGPRGHSSFKVKTFSSFTLFAFTSDEDQHHGHAVAVGAAGTVFTHSKISNRGLDWHGDYPYATLNDACEGGLFGWGGPAKNLPNHGPDLVFWNFNESQGDHLADGLKWTDYNFWDDNSDATDFQKKPYNSGGSGTTDNCADGATRCKAQNPKASDYTPAAFFPSVIGHHGVAETTFYKPSLSILESHGTKVTTEPSLYLAQLHLRLVGDDGSLDWHPPGWDALKLEYKHFKDKGFFRVPELHELYGGDSPPSPPPSPPSPPSPPLPPPSPPVYPPMHDQWCRNGILSSGKKDRACCHKACGKCGGDDCAGKAQTADRRWRQPLCCVRNVLTTKTCIDTCDTVCGVPNEPVNGTTLRIDCPDEQPAPDLCNGNALQLQTFGVPFPLSVCPSRGRRLGDSFGEDGDHWRDREDMVEDVEMEA